MPTKNPKLRDRETPPRRPDYLATVDADPESETYSQVRVRDQGELGAVGAAAPAGGASGGRAHCYVMCLPNVLTEHATLTNLGAGDPPRPRAPHW
jgi:hypothetical protein